MKECPICKAVAFDDAQVCYGCLHRFEPGEGAMRIDGGCGQGTAGGAPPAPASPPAPQGAASAPAPAQAPSAAAVPSQVQPAQAPPAAAPPQAPPAPVPAPQAVSLSVPASDIVVRIEVVGAAMEVGASGESSAASRHGAEQACALLRRSGGRSSVTACPAEEQRGASAGRKAQGTAPARERARHAVKDEREVVVA